jgi:hypothetical protein
LFQGDYTGIIDQKGVGLNKFEGYAQKPGTPMESHLVKIARASHDPTKGDWQPSDLENNA